MTKRFSKAKVIETIAQLEQGTRAHDLWDEYPGIREGRLRTLSMAATLAAQSQRINKRGFGTELRATAAQIRAANKIDQSNGCAQVTGKPRSFAEAYGQYAVLCDLIIELDL